MKQLTSGELGVINQLGLGVIKRGREIANALLITPKEVSRRVSQIRKKFTKGNENAVYIHLTKNGYSLEERPEYLKYEGVRRLKAGSSMILNGSHIYRRYKAIDISSYNNLRINFIPTALRVMDTVRAIKEE